MSAFDPKADIGWTRPKMRLGIKLRLVYCRASPHPTRGKCIILLRHGGLVRNQVHACPLYIESEYNIQ